MKAAFRTAELQENTGSDFCPHEALSNGRLGTFGTCRSWASLFYCEHADSSCRGAALWTGSPSAEYQHSTSRAPDIFNTMPTIQVGPASEKELQEIADTMGKSRKVVVVTGAGISTNCGIPVSFPVVMILHMSSPQHRTSDPKMDFIP